LSSAGLAFSQRGPETARLDSEIADINDIKSQGHSQSVQDE
jgi:hypothetical protein